MRKVLLVFIFLAMSLQADVLSSILESKKLKVCIWPEYYGISYVDRRTQKLTGIDVDLAREFAKDLHVGLEFVESSFADLIKDVSSYRCHIAMFAIGQTKKRAKHLKLTSPHLSSDIYAIASKSNFRIQDWEDIDKKGIVVAVAKGTYHEDVMKARLQKATLSVLDSMHAREKEVESGRADVFMTDYPFAMRMLEQNSWPKLIKPPKTFHLTPYGWAIAKNEEAFSKRTEQFIQDIKQDGRLLQVAKKYNLEPIVLE